MLEYFQRTLSTCQHCVYVCMYVCTVITYSSKSKDQPGKVLIVNPASDQVNVEMNISCPRSRLRIWSRETGSAVPSRVSLLISIQRLNLVFTYGIPPQFPRRRPFNYLNGHTPSGQSRVYRVTQFRTVGVHCRESAGTRPVNLKVVPNEYCLGRSPWTNSYAPLFPVPSSVHTPGASHPQRDARNRLEEEARVMCWF